MFLNVLQLVVGFLPLCVCHSADAIKAPEHLLLLGASVVMVILKGSLSRLFGGKEEKGVGVARYTTTVL